MADNSVLMTKLEFLVQFSCPDNLIDRISFYNAFFLAVQHTGSTCAPI